MGRPSSGRLHAGCVSASVEKLLAQNQSASRPHLKTAKPLVCSNAVQCMNVKRLGYLTQQQMFPQLKLQVLPPQGVALSLQCFQILWRQHEDQCGPQPKHWMTCQRAVMKGEQSTSTVKVSPSRIPVIYASASMVKLHVPPNNACHCHQTNAEVSALLMVSVVPPLSVRNKIHPCQGK